MSREQKLIDQIHSEFDTAQDRLLSQAKEIIESAIPNETVIETISERLKKVGFINTPTVKRGEEITKVRKEKQTKVVESREQAELIQYYKNTYPFMKFLTEAELDRICKKYDLISAPVGNYTKEVPEKNLRDIEICQRLIANDSPNSLTYFSGEIFCHYEYTELNQTLKKRCKSLKNILFVTAQDMEYISDETRIALGVLESLGITTNGLKEHIWTRGDVETVERNGLFIAAPASHFNLEGLTKKSKHGFFNVFKTEIKDPIVFRYVRGGVQVITKWGLEANDPSLVVPVLN